MLLLSADRDTVADLGTRLSPSCEESAGHVVLMLLLHGGLLVLDLLYQRLLIHELRQGLLLVDELEGHLRVLLPRVNQLKDLIDRHLELEWP